MKKERDKVKEGKKSFFLKKGLIKQLARDEKITELKETGEYEDYSRKSGKGKYLTKNLNFSRSHKAKIRIVINYTQ